MSAEKRRELRRLEGGNIHLALADGSRIDDVQLVSARGVTLWVFTCGEDVFVPVSKVIDFWAAGRMRSAA
jgi:hypothetical protein